MEGLDVAEAELLPKPRVFAPTRVESPKKQKPKKIRKKVEYF